MPVVIEIDHPIVAERLTTLRDASTQNDAFRRALSELSMLLVYEATRNLAVVARPVTTPLTTTIGVRVAPTPMLVPVLRAGLGMLDGALQLLAGAPVGFVGLKRDETTLRADSYVTAIPEDLCDAPVLVLDPMLATGGSLVYALQLLRRANAGPITVVCVLAAPEGLAHVQDSGFAEVTIVTAAVDQHLDDNGYIVPGLGDAGDRQFGAYE